MKESIKIALRVLKMVEGTGHYFELSELYNCVTHYFVRSGDIDRAFEYARKSVEVAQSTGNSYLIAHSTSRLGWVHLINGKADLAIKFMRESLEIYRKIGHTFGICQTYDNLAEIYWTRGDWDAGIECHELGSKVLTHPLAYGGHTGRVPLFAWAYLQKGDAGKAIEICKTALEFIERLGTYHIAQDLAVMEEAYLIMGKREEFISYCRKLREEKQEAIQDLKLTQWYLEPAKLSGLFTQAIFVDEFDSPDLKPEWGWVDPKGGSSYSLSGEASWLEVRAASGSDLWGLNFNPPRLLQAVSGDFAAEVKLKAASSELPSVGGLLVWKDEKNFIRFEKGKDLKDEISLSGSVQGRLDHFGRGMLAAEVVYLRLERIGDRFSAYCSDDGADWMTCGEMSFPAEDPIQVGIHAIGTVGLRGGGYTANATATRFDYFRLLKEKSRMS